MEPREGGSAWQIFRKRIAPAAFFVILLLLVGRTCQNEIADATVIVELGSAAPEVRELRVDLYRAGEDTPVSGLVRTFTDAAPPRIEFTLPVEDASYRLDIFAATARGPIWAERQVEMAPRASVRVSIERELSGPE